MSRKLNMTYVASQKRWTKQVDVKGAKKVFSVSCKQLGCAAGKESSWLHANQWWERKQAELDLDAAESTEATQLARLAANLEAEAARPVSTRTRLATVAADPAPYDRYVELAETILEKDTPEELTPEEAVRSCRKQADEWLAYLKITVGLGQLSVGRYGSYVVQIKPFVAFVGDDVDVATITAVKMERYWFEQANLVGDRKIAQATAKGRWMAAKQFVGRLAENKVIPMPGNMRSRRLKFADPAKVIQTMSKADVAELIGACGKYTGARQDIEKVKLWLLLMLNCGMYQNDVAELGVSEVDFTAGTIRRPRSKTPDGPIVLYRLWPETLRLLTKYGETKSTVVGPRGPRLLLSQRGTPLVLDRIIANGGTSKMDLIRDAVVALCSNVGLTKRPLKLLRKTSATLIADHAAYKYYVDLFLSHTPTTQAEKHYANYSQREFDEATDWLRQQYGL